MDHGSSVNNWCLCISRYAIRRLFSPLHGDVVNNSAYLGLLAAPGGRPEGRGGSVWRVSRGESRTQQQLHRAIKGSERLEKGLAAGARCACCRLAQAVVVTSGSSTHLDLVKYRSKARELLASESMWATTAHSVDIRCYVKFLLNLGIACYRSDRNTFVHILSKSQRNIWLLVYVGAKLILALQGKKLQCECLGTKPKADR
jgi:hypothetical protein